MSKHIPEMDGAQNALNKMRRAAERGTGCRLTAEEIASLELTTVGQLWADDDPRQQTENHLEHQDFREQP